ncbi:MAG: thiamine phosphate synthase [Nitrospinae bacterium]|nr:thiamine phosphate synthase [Nitrospinota bacterium]
MPDFSEIDIYPVTGRSLAKGLGDEQIISALARGGARIVQLREKNLSGREFYELASLYRRETRRHGMLLVINDRVDMALAVEADGVHLGREDMPITAARRVMGPKAIIGGSSHSIEEALGVESAGASYVNLGPIYPTPTKPGATAIGLSAVKRAAAGAIRIPFTVMGGVTMENIGEVVMAGARKIGVVSAIFGAEDLEMATKRLRGRIRGS